MKLERDKLVRMQKTLEQERGRILARSHDFDASGRLSPLLLRELAEIDVAARAVAAELARSTPRLGYGSIA